MLDSDENLNNLVDQALAEADVCTRFVVPKSTIPTFKMRFSEKKSRKQYSNETIAGKKGKKTGRWTRTEHLRFVQAIQLYGEDNSLKLQQHIGTRTRR